MLVLHMRKGQCRCLLSRRRSYGTHAINSFCRMEAAAHANHSRAWPSVVQQMLDHFAAHAGHHFIRRTN